jgi:hypothetical protein
MQHEFKLADALHLPFADKSFDLVFGSPPYCDARTYGIDAQRGCEEWIDWMLAVTKESLRVSKGLVLWVCAGVSRDRCYWPAPEGLLYRGWKEGIQCWRPCYWMRYGIPGSGGPQWFRADMEYVLAFKATKEWLPFANNTAMGKPCRYPVGGKMSNRTAEGARSNARKAREKQPDGTLGLSGYTKPEIANPGNSLHEETYWLKTKVGGGALGDDLAHENEAPFSEALAEFFIKSFCPEGGTVLDPFSGSGTTVCTAFKHGYNAIGTDLRQSQIDLGTKRLSRLYETAAV